jgi:hypothetical protein
MNLAALLLSVSLLQRLTCVHTLTINPLTADMRRYDAVLLGGNSSWKLATCLSAANGGALCKRLGGPACQLKDNCILPSGGTFAGEYSGTAVVQVGQPIAPVNTVGLNTS